MKVNNKKRIIFILSSVFCMVMMVCVAISISLSSSNSTNAIHKEDSEASSDTNPVLASKKQETVYVIASADGTPKKIVVSDWIKNPDNNNNLLDKSSLTNLENVKSDASYIMGENDSVVWNAQGEDIYYRGESNNELPVSLLVTYTLDGVKTSIEDLAGKNGHLVIKYDFINNKYTTVSINNANEKIYVPFLMITGLMLDNDVFSNIMITNGKTINDGDRTFAVGISLPGLNSNLGLVQEKKAFPEYVEIEADVKNFKMTNTVTIATNEVFNKIDNEDLNNFGNTLIDANDKINKLVTGCGDLYDGVVLLIQKSEELISGVDRLASGSSLLVSKNEELVNGAKKTFNALLGQADENIAAAGISLDPLTIENYASSLTALLNSLSEDNVRSLATAQARETVTQQVEQNRENITIQVTSQVKASVEAEVRASYEANVKKQVVGTLGYESVEDYDNACEAGDVDRDVQTQVTETVSQKMEESETQSTINALVEEAMKKDEIKQVIADNTNQTIQDLIAQNMASETVQNQINAAVENAKAGTKKIQALKESLDEYNTFYQGIIAYTNGVSDLNNGIIELKNGLPLLSSGEQELKDGVTQLVNGINDMYQNQIQVAINVLGGDLPTFVTRLKATIDVSKDYTNYSGLMDGTSGSVKFVYRTDEIKIK